MLLFSLFSLLRLDCVVWLKNSVFRRLLGC